MTNHSIAFNDADDLYGTKDQKSTTIQLAISVGFGLIAFCTFCFLRPRWPGLYAARKKQVDNTSALPELPNSFFGWIPVLWRINEQQVLASAGLDAFVFLRFFKFALKFLTFASIVALVVILPVHKKNPDAVRPPGKNNTKHGDASLSSSIADPGSCDAWTSAAEVPWAYHTDYLWMYLIFTYVFTGAVAFFIVRETRDIIEVRQEYLGNQSTITDRTIMLSGIPYELRSEGKIKDFVEGLHIGNVESVTLCRNWSELDKLMTERGMLVRRLEEYWTVHLGGRSVEPSPETLPIVQPPPPRPPIDEEDENSRLLDTQSDEHPRTPTATRDRPRATIRFGRFNLRSMQLDAINYYEEKVSRQDERILAARKKEYEPVPLAFVTMDSVASCQMAVQAVLDPSPLQLIARPSPAPDDVLWYNIYLSRRTRMFRSWSITVLITVLTVFWIAILIPIAGSLKLATIREVFPGLADLLESNPYLSSLIQTQLTTIIVAALTALVPYIYHWLSYMQGMLSRGDVELSQISKNFFFQFFNFFVVFTLLGTAASFYDFLGDSLKDTTKIAFTLAQSLQDLLSFYLNYIILQALGLFPFRLLQIGSIIMYPISRIGAKTPRDYAELVQPAEFSYGFYLPPTLLVFVICMVYSILRSSWKILLSGLAYFIMAHFVYKYQLLYAMDHRPHSTGRGWALVCDYVFVGMIVFQITMIGELALQKAITRAVLIIPLLVITVWGMIVFSRTYMPLLKYIALKSVRQAENEPQSGDGSQEETVDEVRERGLRYINPSLVARLDDVWISDKNARALRPATSGNGNHIV